MTRRSTDSEDWGGSREGGGRPPAFDEPSDVLRITLPTRLIGKLRHKAKADGTPASKLLAKMLELMKDC